jgi:hypothetical protein
LKVCNQQLMATPKSKMKIPTQAESLTATAQGNAL